MNHTKQKTYGKRPHRWHQARATERRFFWRMVGATTTAAAAGALAVAWGIFLGSRGVSASSVVTLAHLGLSRTEAHLDAADRRVEEMIEEIGHLRRELQETKELVTASNGACERLHLLPGPVASRSKTGKAHDAVIAEGTQAGANCASGDPLCY